MRVGALLTCALIAASGCGSEPQSDAKAAPGAVAKARTGLLEGDGKKACDQFTEPARRQLTATLAAIAGGSVLVPCAEVAGSVKRLIPPLDRRRIENLGLQLSAIQGSTAIVQVQGDPSIPGAGLTVDLQKRDGRWLISGWSGGG
jgi:hypothetical protein